MAVYFFEKTIKFQWKINVVVVYHSHSIIFYLMFFQQFDPLHHFVEGGKPLAVPAVFIVEFLRTVDRDADQKIIFFEEAAPVVCQQGTVCLDTVVDLPSASVFLLKFERFLIKVDRTHQCFAAMPGKKHLRHCLAFQIVFDEFFQ